MPIAERGITTGKDFAQLMSALISDIAANRIDPVTAAGICKAGGRLLQVVELQHKYGGKALERNELILAPPRGT